jgi:TPP-dependent 2-oxoacid decarboxylase
MNLKFPEVEQQRLPVEDAIAQSATSVSVSNYLATRLVEAGVEKVFTVPGDFILAMLDEFVRHPNLQLIGCCNELNAGIH